MDSFDNRFSAFAAPPRSLNMPTMLLRWGREWMLPESMRDVVSLSRRLPRTLSAREAESNVDSEREECEEAAGTSKGVVTATSLPIRNGRLEPVARRPETSV